MKEFKKDLKKAEDFAKKHPELIRGYKAYLNTFSGNKICPSGEEK